MIGVLNFVPVTGSVVMFWSFVAYLVSDNPHWLAVAAVMALAVAVVQTGRPVARWLRERRLPAGFAHGGLVPEPVDDLYASDFDAPVATRWLLDPEGAARQLGLDGDTELDEALSLLDAEFRELDRNPVALWRGTQARRRERVLHMAVRHRRAWASIVEELEPARVPRCRCGRMAGVMTPSRACPQHGERS